MLFSTLADTGFQLQELNIQHGPRMVDDRPLRTIQLRWEVPVVIMSFTTDDPLLICGNHPKILCTRRSHLTSNEQADRAESSIFS
jgi:hypothetical protein